jgi:hypothetical protein
LEEASFVLEERPFLLEAASFASKERPFEPKAPRFDWKGSSCGRKGPP